MSFPSLPSPPPSNVGEHLNQIHSQCIILASIDFEEQEAWFMLQNVLTVLHTIVVQ